MPRPSHLHRYLSLRELAAALGEPWSEAARRRLLRMLRARERACGKQILLRRGLGPIQGRWCTTLALLRAHCPELFDRRDMAAELLEERLERWSERERIQDRKINAIGARLRRLEQAFLRDEQ